MTADPVPVADQRAAGVPTGETVTLAEQAAGEPLPDAMPSQRGLYAASLALTLMGLAYLLLIEAGKSWFYRT